MTQVYDEKKTTKAVFDRKFQIGGSKMTTPASTDWLERAQRWSQRLGEPVSRKQTNITVGIVIALLALIVIVAQ